MPACCKVGLEMIFKYHAKFNKRAEDLQFWTHENHAVELSTNEMIDSRLEYIHENPVRAGWVEKAEDYMYSSARNYADLPGLIDVDFIRWSSCKLYPDRGSSPKFNINIIINNTIEEHDKDKAE